MHIKREHAPRSTKVRRPANADLHIGVPPSCDLHLNTSAEFGIY
jgi:hypothetical protein